MTISKYQKLYIAQLFWNLKHTNVDKSDQKRRERNKRLKSTLERHQENYKSGWQGTLAILIPDQQTNSGKEELKMLDTVLELAKLVGPQWLVTILIAATAFVLALKIPRD